MNIPNSLARCGNALAALLACTLLVVLPAHADPAGRIGRIAWLSAAGTVRLYNPDSGELLSAPLNQPLTSGDIVTTEPGSLAEIQIGSMTVRLDVGSELVLDRIDDEHVQLFLNNGRVIVKLPSRDALGDFEMTTRNGQFTARDTGIYRFDTEGSNSSATSYYGALHFESSDSQLDIDAGQSVRFWTAGQTRYRQSTAINDDFTRWSAERDRRPAATTYSRFVSPEMTGAEDLDAYGNWSETAEYGAIWTPRAVAADWAPYRTGHWAWVAPWGWNWVGNEPWGFAPFHYGRWVQHRGAWGWVPGARVVRPVYAPAMVAWMGSPGVGVSISVGTQPTVGWFPLAPREVYVPAFRSSANYVRKVNVTHVANITNVTNIVNNPQAVIQQMHYAHREMPRAVTMVPSDVVTQQRPVESAVVSPRDRRDLQAQAVQAAAPVAAPPIAPPTDARGRSLRPDDGQAFPRGRREPQPPAPAIPAQPGIAQAPAPVSTPVAPTPQASSPPPLAIPPVETRNRRENQERSIPPSIRQEREQPALVVVPQTTQQIPVVAAQRSERPAPEIIRPAPQQRPEPLEVRVQPAPPSLPAVETRTRPENQERSPQPVVRPDREQPAPVAALPAAPPVQVAPAPRSERTAPEMPRPAPQVRPEPLEVRPAQRQEPARMQAAATPVMPVAPAPQQMRQAPPPARIEPPAPAPREASRPPEPRPEARAPQQAERPRSAQDEEEWKRRHRGDAGQK